MQSEHVMRHIPGVWNAIWSETHLHEIWTW